MPGSQPTRGSLRSYIRYQLSQLSSRNGQHEFEQLAYDLARIRVASNLLPATGPVQAGGDQGRDFESYRTFLASSPLSAATFIGNASRGLIAGACTLDKRILRKIKSDLSTIFAHGERPTHVAYFCEPDIPIAKRHVLQSFCTVTYGATLDIFDGNTIADMLADTDARGVAFEHLEIPSELWPAPGTLDPEYSVSRTRWLSRKQRPLNWADFFEIKLGLRTATFNEEAKPDLPNWIATMKTFLYGQSPPRMAQKARYEVSVAELRGQGSLDPALPLVIEFGLIRESSG